MGSKRLWQVAETSELQGGSPSAILAYVDPFSPNYSRNYCPVSGCIGGSLHQRLDPNSGSAHHRALYYNHANRGIDPNGYSTPDIHAGPDVHACSASNRHALPNGYPLSNANATAYRYTYANLDSYANPSSYIWLKGKSCSSQQHRYLPGLGDFCNILQSKCQHSDSCGKPIQ